MKFIRRPDLTPQTRIHIVMLAWLNQGVYGKMTQIAKAYRISRSMLYPTPFGGHPPAQSSSAMTNTRCTIHHLRLTTWPCYYVWKVNAPSYLSGAQHLGYQPHSVGHLSQSLQQYGQALPATVSMASQTVVFYLSDEIFAHPNTHFGHD